MHITLIIIYTLALIGVSFRYYQQSPEAEDFQIGKRQFDARGIFASTVTIIGGGELLTVAALAFDNDGAAVTLLAGYGIGLAALGGLSTRLRAKVANELYHSLPDYFYATYGKLAGVLASLATGLAFYALLVLQFSAGAVVLCSLAPGLPFWILALASASVVVVYLCLAGFRGVVLTDKIQLTALLVGLPLLAFLSAPFPDGLVHLANLDFTLLPTVFTLFTGMFVILGSGDIWQRMYAAHTDRVARRGLVAAGVGFTLIGILLALIGLATRIQGLTDDPNSAFVAASLAIQNPFISSLVLLAIFSAILSTADTETFLLAGLIAREWARWRKGYKKNSEASRTTNIRFVRFLIVGIAIAGAIVSLGADSLVNTYNILVHLLLVLAPVVVVGAFLSVSPRAACVSIISGVAVFLPVMFFGTLSLDQAVYFVIPGFVVCLWSGLGSVLFK